MNPFQVSEMPDTSQALRRAKTWLMEAYLSTDRGEHGWGHYLGEPDPTVWGGTLDGLRALLYMGYPPLSDEITKSVAWLKKQQRADGGFGTRELNYSSAEATAWVVICFAQLGLTGANDATVKKAVLYLTKCVDPHGGVATTPLDFATPRTFPATLVLWALSKQSGFGTICGLLVEKLRALQNGNDQGWGVRFGATSNVASTSQVLVAIHEAGVSIDSEWVLDGAKYLSERQEADGSYRNAHDEWFTIATPTTPYRCSHFATAWAILALSPFERAEFRTAALRAVRYLLNRQSERGSWPYEDFDPSEHVWCTTQAIVALIRWHQQQKEVAHDKSSAIKFARQVSNWAFLLISWIRASFLYLVVSTLVLYQFRHQIYTASDWLVRHLRIDASSVWNNIVSSVVWLILLLALNWIGKSLTLIGKKE